MTERITVMYSISLCINSLLAGDKPQKEAGNTFLILFFIFLIQKNNLFNERSHILLSKRYTVQKVQIILHVHLCTTIYTLGNQYTCT